MLLSEILRLPTGPPMRGFPGVWKLLFFKTPFLGWISIPASFFSLFIFYIFVLPPFEDNGLPFWVPGVLCQHLEVVCGICSTFKCSLDEFVGEKLISPSYSSTILGPPLFCLFFFLYYSPDPIHQQVICILPTICCSQICSLPSIPFAFVC